MEMTTLEQTMETISALPPAARQRLQLFLQEQAARDAAAQPPDSAAQAKAERLRQELDEYRRAKQWIAAHRAEYLGQWVALEGDRLVSHGPDVLQVDAAARAAGIASPLLCANAVMSGLRRRSRNCREASSICFRLGRLSRSRTRRMTTGNNTMMPSIVSTTLMFSIMTPVTS